MNADPPDPGGPGQDPAVPKPGYSVEVRESQGVQVGERNTQINYTYNRLTWVDGLAPPPLVSVSGEIDSPYRGLNAFEERDAPFFFGREAAVGQVIDRMARQLAGAGLLVVSGVSGAGKSSLLRAGVIPRIRGTGLAAAPEAATWPCLVLTPTPSPLDELALRIALLGGAGAGVLRQAAQSDPAAFALAVRQAALTAAPPSAGPPGAAAGQRMPSSPRLLIVVDQFEQVFTQCPDEAERAAFIAALHAAATLRHGAEQQPAALVVLGVRADFEARCADYPELADAVQNRYLVTAMTARQLRLAITEPARQAGAEVAPDLADLLLAEVRARQHGGSGPGVLPLLSHALDQAWRSRSGPHLTPADYERTGGIERAVADSAQRAYDTLTAAQQAAARQVFIRLTAVGADNVDTAQRATRVELTDGISAAQASDVAAVLEGFAAERLLTLAADSVEISHEVLLTAWPLLRDNWLGESHADRVVRTRLRNAAAEWELHSRDPSYLYGGTLLEAATETVARIDADPGRNPPLSQAERDFLRAGDRSRLAQARRRRAVLAGLLTLALAAVAGGGVALVNAANANRQTAIAVRQHAIALSRQLAAQAVSADPTDVVTARRLAAAAWHVYPTSEAGSAMVTLLAEQQQWGMLPASTTPVSQVAFSADGKLLASSDDAGTVRIWDVATSRPVGRPLPTTSRPDAHPYSLGIAFSPDGRLLAAAGHDRRLWIWNAADGKPVGVPLRPDDQRADIAPDVVAFSPDGKLLAAGCNDGTVRLWDLTAGHPVGPPVRRFAGPYSAVTTIAFSPDGTALAAGSDGQVRLWSTTTGRLLGAPLQVQPSGSSGSVNTVAFSPDGKLMATYATSGLVRLWNPATGRLVRQFLSGAPSNSAEGMAFSPDGRLLAVADGNARLVRLWNPATGRQTGETLAVNSTVSWYVNGLAFSPRGHVLAGAAGDGTVRLWDLDARRFVGQPLRAGTVNTFSVIYDLAFRGQGDLLAAISSDGLVRLWDPATGRQTGKPLQAGETSLGGSLAISPDGTRLATAGISPSVEYRQLVRVWNPVTGRPAGPWLQPAGTTDALSAVAFSPDGDLLAAAGDSPMITLWDRSGRRRVISTGGDKDPHPFRLAFSPDGTLLAGGLGNVLRMWNPVTGRPAGVPVRVSGDTGVTIYAIAFSPDGKVVATADGAGTVQLWNPLTGHRVGRPLPHSAEISRLAFSPDGSLLAGVGIDGTLRLWDPATGRLVSEPFRAADLAEKLRAIAFSPDGAEVATAGNDGAIRRWRVWPLAHPYEALCTTTGAPTSREWAKYAPGEPQPAVC
ncbi:NACHT and WD repeat domain-containing protein [Sphaerisporangium rhizosphaerae]|uniref:NACHT and WD repeat domain-containing protein n=1 Tax=Sphaerisporangium rhizosphaerae TaxID=2269375 RepID=A0ABW2P3G3_9ACTN